MSTLTAEPPTTRAQSVTVTEDSLAVDLTDGRTVSAPLAWFPRLLHGTPRERARWRLIGSGQGIHWPELDEDISVANLLAGQRSGESQSSFKRWLDHRQTRAALPTTTVAESPGKYGRRRRCRSGPVRQPAKV